VEKLGWPFGRTGSGKAPQHSVGEADWSSWQSGLSHVPPRQLFVAEHRAADKLQNLVLVGAIAMVSIVMRLYIASQRNRSGVMP
jgi:hypothetical protein